MLMEGGEGKNVDGGGRGGGGGARPPTIALKSRESPSSWPLPSISPSCGANGGQQMAERRTYSYNNNATAAISRGVYFTHGHVPTYGHDNMCHGHFRLLLLISGVFYNAHMWAR